MNKQKITVAVSGLNATDNPGPGVPVIRSLREAKSFDVRIIGFSYESLEPGIYMHNLVDKTYQIPYPSSGADVLLKRINYINAIEKIDVLIPNFDAELYSFMKIENDLKDIGIHTFLPTIKQFEERHKVNLTKFGKKYKIDVPRDKAIYTPLDIYSLTPEFTYPLFVKGQFYDAYPAYSPEQANFYFNKINTKWGVPVIIQQLIHGTEVNVIGLGDGKGNTIAAVPMKKQYITDKGKAWAGISINDKKLLEITDKFISSTKWRGGFELEVIKTDDNKYFLLEINPRIPAWVYLAVGSGQNIPEALVNLALGKKVKPYTKFDIGKLFIRYSYDLIVDLKEFEQISTYGEL
jgi:carbamoyl-phosphate synthase large subunit